jgi:hypothetical protein
MVVSSLPNLAASCSPTAATKAPVVMLSPMVRASVRQFLKFWGVIVDLLLLLLISGFVARSGRQLLLSVIQRCPFAADACAGGTVGFSGHAALALNHRMRQTVTFIIATRIKCDKMSSLIVYPYLIQVNRGGWSDTLPWVELVFMSAELALGVHNWLAMLVRHEKMWFSLAVITL